MHRNNNLSVSLLLAGSLLLCAAASWAQAPVAATYWRADSLLRASKVEVAYKLYRSLEPQVPKGNSLYKYVVWYYLGTATELERQHRLHEEFASALQYGREALKLIQDHKALFDQKFAEREPWMVKNLVVSCFGLGKLDEAARYKALLYAAHQENRLPEGIDKFFNFDFLVVGGYNVWGYEWYAELPANRFASSFTKVVYYVYSRNADGTDNQQLYRFHVLMFHQEAKDARFAYILERQQETETATVSGSYYHYTYQQVIDYKKLREDVNSLVLSGQEPDSRRTLPRQR